MISEKKEGCKAMMSALERSGCAVEKIGASMYCNGLPDLLVGVPGSDGGRGSIVLVELKRALRRKVSTVGDVALMLRSGKERSRQLAVAADFGRLRTPTFVAVCACDPDVESVRDLKSLPDVWAVAWCGDFVSGRLDDAVDWGSLESAVARITGR